MVLYITGGTILLANSLAIGVASGVGTIIDILL